MKRTGIPDTGVSTIDGPADNPTAMTWTPRSGTACSQVVTPNGTRTGV
jgi:hypothetical protein